MSASKNRYHWSLRLMHWLMGILLIAMIVMGFIMVGASPDIKSVLYPLHKQVGITLLFLSVLRLLIRFTTFIPPSPEEISLLYRRMGKIIHYSMYLLVVLAPLSGYIMSSASGKPVVWFFGFELPGIVGFDADLAKSAHGAHGKLGYIILALIVLHILGSIKHSVVDKLPFIRRML